MTRIKECLDRIGQTQKWLAVTMGVKQPSVHDWIIGKNTPSTENLKRLSDIFGVSTDYLLGVDTPERTQAPDPFDAVRDATVELNERGKLMLSNYHKLTPENQIRVSAYIEGILSGQGS